MAATPYLLTGDFAMGMLAATSLPMHTENALSINRISFVYVLMALSSGCRALDSLVVRPSDM